MATTNQKDLVDELKFLLNSGKGLKATPLNFLIGKIPYKTIDRELALQLISHPSVTMQALRMAFDYTFEFDAENLDAVVASCMNNVTFAEAIWDWLTRFVIRQKNYKDFLLSVNKFLSSSSSGFNSEKLSNILELSIAGMSGEYELEVCGYDVIFDYFLSIFDHVNFSIESVLSSKIKTILLSQEYRESIFDGPVIEAIHKSKNAVSILLFMFEITGNPDYLPKDIKDIFWFP